MRSLTLILAFVAVGGVALAAPAKKASVAAAKKPAPTPAAKPPPPPPPAEKPASSAPRGAAPAPAATSRTTSDEAADAAANAARRGPTRVDFDDRLVQGQSTKQGAIYLFERKESALRSMLRKRENFRAEIGNSIQ